MASVSDPRTRKAAAATRAPPQDFLVHLEAYLTRRDGVDKLLKISRYAARLTFAAWPPLPPAASGRLKSFESSVGLSRKAFRLGKFVQDVNALRVGRSPLLPSPLVLLAYGGEGVYYFLEQFVWLAKAGLLPTHLLPRLQRLSAWAEVGLARGGGHRPLRCAAAPSRGGGGELLRWGWPGAAKQRLQEEQGGGGVVPAAPRDRGDGGGEAGDGQEIGRRWESYPFGDFANRPSKVIKFL